PALRALALLGPRGPAHGAPVRGDPPHPPGDRAVHQPTRLRRTGRIRTGDLRRRLTRTAHHRIRIRTQRHDQSASHLHPGTAAPAGRPQPAGDAAPARLRGGPGPRRHPGRAARHHRHHRVRLGREPAPDPRRRGRAARGRARPGDPVPDRRGRARPPPRCRARARTGHPAGPATGLSEVAHMSAEAPAERRRREDREPAGSLLQPLLQWATLTKLVNALVPVLLIGMAAAPLEAVYLDAGLWVTVVVALLLGGLLAVIGAAYRLGILTMISVTVVVFFVCGALAAPSTALLWFHPTPTLWQLLGVGMLRVWKPVRTVRPPLGTGGVVLLLPYVRMLLGGLVAVTVSLRARRLYYLSLVLPVLVPVP